MCGFLACYHHKSYKFTKEEFLKSLNLLNHRGPDATGYVELDLGSYYFKMGHKRLSIIDLNVTGNQPMDSFTKKYTIIFNGEIYNHNILRKEIDNLNTNNWKGSSDTETLINLFEFYETKKIVSKLSGQFSFLIYDNHEKNIKLIRDRAGEKPLYISTNNQYIGFSSDLSVFKNFPNYQVNISQNSISSLLKLNYIPSPNTIFSNNFKLPPGSIIDISLIKYAPKKENSFQNFINSNGVNFYKYWQNYNFINKDKKNYFNKNINYEEELEKLLQKSVKEQLLSDVPLGAFLSGGIDSSLIVSLMQKEQTNTKTYNIGFDFDSHDESRYAKEVAQILGTDHTNHIFSKDDILNLIPLLPQAYSEPFADSSSLPTMLVSKIASQNVKVVLSGDGGDELFGGYNRYLYANKYWKTYNLIPDNLRKIFCKSLLKFDQNILNLLHDKITYSSKLRKILSKIIYIDDEYTFYDSLISEWRQDSNIFNKLQDNDPSINKQIFLNNNNMNFEEKMMFSDFNGYLPDDILCKVDRATMFYSVECRPPFLNKDLVEFAFFLPFKLKIYNNNTKYLLKKILSKYIPQNLINRPKHGFGIPLGDWMKNELKDWMLDNLSKEVCSKHDFFNYEVLSKTINNHLSGKENNESKLWSILQFNQWYQEYVK